MAINASYLFVPYRFDTWADARGTRKPAMAAKQGRLGYVWLSGRQGGYGGKAFEVFVQGTAKEETETVNTGGIEVY